MLTLTIEQITKKYSITETELAYRVGLSVSMISKLKHGATTFFISCLDIPNNSFYLIYNTS